MTGRLIYEEVSFSTAEIAESQFVGESRPSLVQAFIDESPVPLTPGCYRVIDGELFEVVDDDAISTADDPRTQQV